ncbi:MAG: saccharopine dehydrogenase NADP-binding domain-containing protein [Candidatus Aenigmatarchaeota archaeon]|nr:MAG: saccharopine dehydrogenase NADP-binding domain-containing protein [Candidatus Aenigmarchaeota archaeon]
MAFDVVVLGATGIQGRISTRDLLESGYSVLMCGRDRKRIEHLLKKYGKTAFEYVDLRLINYTTSVIKKSGASVVLNCAEGDWNLHALKACMKAKAHCLDLGSEIGMTKSQFALHDKLVKLGLVSITGCGSTPGINNVMLRYAAQKLDRVHSVDVGFAWSSNMETFVVPFSIRSILGEFIEPATLLKNGRFVHVKPRDVFIEQNCRDVGVQKSFFVKHPEVYTFYRFLKSRGLRNSRVFAGFPEHSYRKIMDLIELGIESKKKIVVEGKDIKTADFLAELLKELKIPKGYREKENLWLKVTGTHRGKEKTIHMECVVSTLKGWEDATCNVDTGMPASVMAQMVLDGTIKERGSYAPEMVVPPKPFFRELAKRKMAVYENGKRIN